MNKTRGNHTDPAAIERLNKLPEVIREHVWTNDPCHSSLPPGWTELVVKLHNHLVKFVPDYRIEQIKEKFGGLRFYTDIKYDPDSIPNILLQHYEDRSLSTCDVCGGYGKKVSTGKLPGRIMTRCAEHT